MSTTTASERPIVLNAPHAAFSELQLSPRPVSIAFLVIGFLTVLASDIWSAPDQARYLVFVLFTYLAAGLIEILWHWRPLAGSVSAIFMATLVIPFGIALWDEPGFVAFAPLPVVLAVVLLSLRAGAVTAGAQSLLLLLVTQASLVHLDSATSALAVMSLWLAFGLLVALYLPVTKLERWSLHYVFRTQQLLDEARDRNAELDQLLGELVHVNRQLDLTNERLVAARAAAEEAQKSKSIFVARVSHELRTPLNMIIGLTDFLLQEAGESERLLSQEMLKDIQIIHRNSEHLSKMINDVLDLSQIEANRLILRSRWMNLASEIQDAVGVVKPLLDRKGLRLEMDIEQDLPEVYCDPVRIRQVILNLVGNAAKHTERGSVRIQAVKDDQYVTVSVTDTGPGIDPRDLTRIFEPFYQGNPSTAGGAQGTGLGLTVSKQFIEQHNGTIWAESELGKGTTFTFRLRRTLPTTPPTRADRWISEDWIWRERTAPVEMTSYTPEWRVIICDRSERVYPLFAQLVSSATELVETQSLEQTIANLENIPAHLVILHEDEPVELSRSLLVARGLIPDTPLVGCTIPAMEAVHTSPDIVDYLTKPITRADLRDVLDTLSPCVQHVLVVDDDFEVRELFSRMLLDLDGSLQVTTAGSGEEALQWMRKAAFDLVLLDLVLPDQSGWSVLEKKQTVPQMREVPVLITSAQDPDLPVENGILFAMTTGGGVPAEFILQCGFLLASRLLKSKSKLDPGLRETAPS